MNTINNNLMATNVVNSLNSNYGKLATSVERLSSGLRINSAADDAAGLAIRELMRADVAALNQGVRNANDAISMIQVADGALSIIDEKLIRMKELAEQAATGTYNSTQRLMISSEYQAMGDEIERIARATNFNGIKLLDGSLSGTHDGSSLNSTGKMKIHFGSTNDSAEDYYYVSIPNAGLLGLGLGEVVDMDTTGQTRPHRPNFTAGYASADQAAATLMGDGVTVISATFSGNAAQLGIYENSPAIQSANNKGVILSTGDVQNAQNSPDGEVATEWDENNPNGDPFINSGAVDQYDAAMLDIVFRANTNMIYFNFVFATEEWPDFLNTNYNDVCSIILDGDAVNGNFARLENIISIDGEPVSGNLSGSIDLNTIFNNPDFFIDNKNGTQNFAANGFSHVFRIGVPVTPNQVHTLHFSVVDLDDATLDSWILVDSLSADAKGPEIFTYTTEVTRAKAIETQEKAQKALVALDNAIVTKDKIRAHLGALQNRLENTISNISIQSENLQAAESRISDVDIAKEMTALVRNQILTQSAVAMLGQANSYPHMLSSLITG